MNIIQATAAALEKRCCIQRVAYGNFLKLKPTKSCYEVIGSFNKKKKRPRFWDSTTEDILADDWFLTD